MAAFLLLLAEVELVGDAPAKVVKSEAVEPVLEPDDVGWAVVVDDMVEIVDVLTRVGSLAPQGRFSRQAL